MISSNRFASGEDVGIVEGRARPVVRKDPVIVAPTSAPQRPPGVHAAGPAEPEAGRQQTAATARRHRVPVAIGAAALVLSGVGAVGYSSTSSPDAPDAPAAGSDSSLRSLSIAVSPDAGARVGAGTGPGSSSRNGSGPGGDGGADRGNPGAGAATPTTHRLTRKTHLVEDRDGALVRVSRDVDSDDLQQQGSLQARQRMVALQELAQAAQDKAFDLGAGQWVLPLAGFQLSAGFGESGSMWAATHSGQDFAAAEGTPLVAMAAGVVVQAGNDRGASWAGKLTVLRLTDGTELWYAHQSSIRVRAGDTVAPGQVIGAVGDTGNSTGPHLHLEVRPTGGEAVDPLPALAEHGVPL